MSAASVRRWRTFAAPLARRMLGRLALVSAMNAVEAAHLRQLCCSARFGAPCDLKTCAAVMGAAAVPTAAGAELARAVAAEWRAGRFVWLAASTHAPEEVECAAAHALLCAAAPRAPKPLLLLVPRQPERAADIVAELALSHPTLRTAQYSAGGVAPMRHADVFLVDALGLLAPLYAATGAAFVGNSLRAGGRGHNLAEAAAAGAAVLVGPHLGPFAEMAAQLRAAGGPDCVQAVADGAALGAALAALRDTPDEAACRGRCAQNAARRLAGCALDALARDVSAALLLDAPAAGHRPWTDTS